ncbi:SDR family NAD(P)-dependent oxidoreductase [Novosphingobium sp.]|uniref:SDR family NAD(P)-dependent oxidoreductase n=1 Tax=Novosphingobium sp. TaxID=1874826 RepID=UPI0035B4DAF0
MSVHPAIAPGQVAVITGGANGIGLAVARRLVDLGLRVALADCDAAQLAAAGEALGGKALLAQTDVASRASVAALAARVEAELGPVAVLMNNAAIGGGGDILADPAAWDRLLAVNLHGVIHGLQQFLPGMIASDRPGLVINTGSKQGITQPPGNTAYNVAKSGVKSVTEGLAHTLRERVGDRITAHLLIPGFTYTGMTTRHFKEKPPAAWTPDQVAQTMLDGIARRDFYLWCLDNETSWEVDRRRVLWTAQDITEGRPALSRWHPDWKDVFADFASRE